MSFIISEVINDMCPFPNKSYLCNVMPYVRKNLNKDMEPNEKKLNTNFSIYSLSGQIKYLLCNFATSFVHGCTSVLL